MNAPDTDELWSALGDAFRDALYAPPPLTDEQMRHIAEQYQRDAIASAQSTMPDDESDEQL